MLHVGKSSAGWSFSFRGHRHQIDGSPDIVSAADWARVFKTVPGVLKDEYDRVVDNPLMFLENLDRPSLEKQEIEDSPERRGKASPYPDPMTEWHDIEGFRFYDGEFS